MCPIIEGADMTKISTERENLPEGIYKFTIIESEFSDDGSSLIIKRRVEEAPAEGEKFLNQVNWDWINIKDNSGKTNEIGFQTIKKYLECVFGKGSPESLSNDTDPLNGHVVEIYVVEKGSKKEPDKLYNNNKRFISGS